MYGVPSTLLTTNLLPISNGTVVFLTSRISLGLSTSIIVVEVFSISKPLTYALPGETFSASKSSDGVFPCSVL